MLTDVAGFQMVNSGVIDAPFASEIVCENWGMFFLKVIHQDVCLLSIPVSISVNVPVIDNTCSEKKSLKIICNFQSVKPNDCGCKKLGY